VIRAGVIGTGNISGVHLRYLQSRDDVQIAALCDTNPDNLQRRREQFAGTAYADFREMLDREPLDAVWICTPQAVRREPLLACADCGVAIFCEKPVARTVAEAESTGAELKARSARVQVGYVFRSLPVVRRLREEIRDDVIRVVGSFYACNKSLRREGFPPWFYDKEVSGGNVLDQATHNLDLLRYLFGDVRRVQAMAANPHQPKEPGYTIDETFVFNLAFASGPLVSHNHTWLADRWRDEMLLSGQKRLYRLDLWNGVLTVEDGRQTRTFRSQDRPMHDYENELFCRLAAGGDWRDNPCPYDDAVETLRVTLACDEAIERGRVELPAGVGD